MKFWKRLRWALSLAFLALAVFSWLGSDAPPPAPGGTAAPTRLAPQF